MQFPGSQPRFGPVGFDELLFSVAWSAPDIAHEPLFAMFCSATGKTRARLLAVSS